MVTLLLMAGCGAVLGSGTYNQAFAPQEKCKAVHFWVTKFSTEVPQKLPDGEKSILGYYQKLSVNLFRDKYFVPVYGTPFDQMSDHDQQVLGNAIERCFTMLGGYKDWQDLNRYYGAVIPHWRGIGSSFSASARETNQWQDRVLAELRSAPPSEETFEKLLQSKARAKTVMERFLPVEQQAFNEALDREGRRVAEAALVDRIDRAVAAASTYEGLKQLQTVLRDTQGLFEMVSPTVKAREAARVTGAYEKGFSTALEGEWRRFEARGTGFNGVKNGVAWYRNFEDRYIVPFDFGPLTNEFLKRFRAAREKDLTEAATSILQFLNGTGPRTIDELDLRREEYLVEEDELVSAARPIHAWFEHQKAVLNFEREKWRFSKNELALMKTPGLVDVPSSYGPPSGDDIRMALLRAYGGLIDQHTATVYSASFDDLLGTIGRGGLPRMAIAKISIGTVTVEQCSEGKGSALIGNYGNSKGYLCRYKAGGQVSSFPMPMGLGNSDQFMLTSEGWRSPTADDRIAENRNRMTTKFIEDVGSALPKPGCWGRRAIWDPACQK